MMGRVTNQLSESIDANPLEEWLKTWAASMKLNDFASGTAFGELT